MKTYLHSHFKALKFTMIKLCLLALLFQVIDLKAQNPILLDHTWYFEIGSIDGETLVTPSVPEDNPTNYPFESTLELFIENDETFFSITQNYCDNYRLLYVDFSDDSSTFMNIGNLELGLSCDFLGASIFSNQIHLFFNFDLSEPLNPFNYTIEEVDNYYKLTITNNDGDWLVYNSVLLSNPTFSESCLSLFPNPMQDILNIQNTESNLSKVQIYDLNGRLLQNHFVQNNEVSLDVSQLTSGVYVVVLENEIGNQISRKIVKTGK